MGLGNGLDDAPPGVTEDHRFYDERVDDGGGDDTLENNFFLFDEDEGSGQGGSWTDMTESDDSMDNGPDSISENGWADEVENDDKGGKGRGRGKDELDDQEGADNGDTLDAFDQDAEDFPDQSDW
nr:hypothetical protein [uncultured Pseudodesulfovibrio sp.]